MEIFPIIISKQFKKFQKINLAIFYRHKNPQITSNAHTVPYTELFFTFSKVIRSLKVRKKQRRREVPSSRRTDPPHRRIFIPCPTTATYHGTMWRPSTAGTLTGRIVVFPTHECRTAEWSRRLANPPTTTRHRYGAPARKTGSTLRKKRRPVRNWTGSTSRMRLTSAWAALGFKEWMTLAGDCRKSRVKVDGRDQTESIERICRARTMMYRSHSAGRWDHRFSIEKRCHNGRREASWDRPCIVRRPCRQ